MKKFLALLIVAVMALTLVACGAPATTTTAPPPAGNNNPPAENNPPAAEGTQIGIVLPTKDEPRWLQDEAKFNEVIGGTSLKCEILFSQKDSTVERSNVEALITKGVKVIILCPQDAALAAATADYCQSKGVKVISYDRLITETANVDYYVTFDSVNVGEKQGGYLVEQASGQGNPLYLYAGDAGDNNAFLFFEGAWNMLQPKIADGTFTIMNSSEAEKLKGKKDLTYDEQATIIGQITTKWNFDEAKKLAENNITANPPPAGKDVFLLAPNDGTGRAIADAFTTTGNKFFVTGQDAEKDSVQYVIDGKQSMTVFKDTRTLAKDAMDMAIAICNGQTPSTTATYNNKVKEVPSKQTAVVVVTKDNVKAALIDSAYYAASDFSGL